LQSALASVAAVLLFDVLFTTPRYTLTVHDTEYLVTFQ
jgi:K+-sensing histidine kinase KdpD